MNNQKTMPYQLLPFVNQGISKSNKTISSDYILGLLSVMDRMSPTLNSELTEILPSLTPLLNKGFNPNSSNLTTTNDPLLASFLEEIRNNHFVITPNGNLLTVYPDLNWVLHAYGTYMQPDLKGLVVLNNKNNTKPFFNPKSKSVNLLTLTTWINDYRNLKNTYPTTPLLSSIQSAIAYYEEIYFGVNGNFIFNKNKQIKKEYLTEYDKEMQTNPHSKLTILTKDFLSKINNNHGKMDNAINVWITEQIAPTKVVEVANQPPTNVTATRIATPNLTK
jgi:hypothetical protein